MLVLTATLLIIYLIAPFTVGGGGYFNQRFPWVIFLLLLPLLASVSVHRWPIVNILIVIAALLSLCINTAIFKQQSNEVSIFLEGLNSGCSKGDLIMLYKAEQQGIDVILHASSYYGLLNGCVDIGNYETARSYFPIHFKKNLDPHPTTHKIFTDPSSIDFSQYPALVEVIGWELQAEAQEKLQGYYDISFANDKLTLWRRR